MGRLEIQHTCTMMAPSSVFKSASFWTFNNYQGVNPESSGRPKVQHTSAKICPTPLITVNAAVSACNDYSVDIVNHGPVYQKFKHTFTLIFPFEVNNFTLPACINDYQRVNPEISGRLKFNTPARWCSDAKFWEWGSQILQNHWYLQWSEQNYPCWPQNDEFEVCDLCLSEEGSGQHQH